MSIPIPVQRRAARPAGAQAVRRAGPGAWLMLLALLAALAAPVPALAQRGTPETFAPLAEKLLPAVVNISSSQTVQNRGRGQVPLPEFPPGSPFEEFFRDFFEQQQQGQGQGPNTPPRRAQSLGSGFIIDPTGYIVTNNHVIEGADEITVRLQDDTNLKATLVGVDPATDLALLKVDAGRKLPALPWGDSDAIKVGDWVVAIGNPFGLGGSVTAGIISARARDIGQGNYDDFLQTDASINMGNSGGPLINMAGEVVGINTAIFSRTGGSIGIGFAIPATLAKNVVAQLREGGKVRRGWLGVQISAVDQAIAESMGLKEAKGALVGVVSDNGPAKAAGIKPGDVILSFDGKEVTNNRALPRIVAETPVGKKVAVNLFRKGERLTVPVTLGELKEDAQVAAAPQGESNPGPDPQTIEPVGVAVAPLSPQVRQQFQLDEDTSGVVVTKVTPNSPAAQRGLRAGDVIVEVSQEEVASPADVSTRVQKAKEAGQKALLLLIERGGELLFVALPLAEG